MSNDATFIANKEYTRDKTILSNIVPTDSNQLESNPYWFLYLPLCLPLKTSLTSLNTLPIKMDFREPSSTIQIGQRTWPRHLYTEEY